jgi:hypothetical protein
LFGFFIGDPENVVNGRFGPNSGVFVTINPENTSEPVALSGYTFEQQDTFPFDFLKGAAPQPGDLVEVTGDNSERFGMRNIRFVTSLTKTGTGTLPQPALFGTGGNPTGDLKGGRPAFSDGDFSTGFTPALENVAPSANVEQWEAVLVELKDVTTTTACYAQPFDPNTAVSNDSFARDFGNWLVTGDVEIGTTFRFPQAFGGFFRDDAPNAVPLNQRTCANAGASKCQDSRVQGQAFTSLVGIVDFSFNVHRVSPRSAADIVGPAFVAANTGACPAQ